MSARKVIIRGHVFDYEEKAPFVASGESVLGATEYDEDRDLLKCHECGDWHRQLPFHSVRKHGMNARAYKERHGLLYTSSLVAPKLRQFKSELNRKSGSSQRLKPNYATISRGHKHGGPHESRNEHGRCQAQTLFKIRTLAAQLGHTPCVAELKANGIHPSSIRYRFGVTTLTPVMEMAGLAANQQGNFNKKPFDNERMPWPKEYFSGVTPDVALRRVDRS